MRLNIDTNCITYLKSLQSLPLQQAVSSWDNLKEINYISLNSAKPSIYIDIDGTLAYFYRDGRGFTYEKMFYPENHYFRNLEPHIYMIYLVEALSKLMDVCIISSADYKTIQDKYEWIKEYLPFISDNNIFFCPLGVDKTKFVKGNAEKSILIDDYNLNLEAWDKNGGIAIKAINSINTPTERFAHINVKDKEKWLKSQMESSGDEQIEKLKARMIETQIKKWVKADIKFIRQTLNIRMKGMVDMKSYKMENGLEVEIDRTYKFFDLWDGKGDGEEVLRSCAVWVGNDADGMPIIANFEIMEYDPETPEKSMIKVVDIW